MRITLAKDVMDLGQEHFPEGRARDAIARFGNALSNHPAQAGANYNRRYNLALRPSLQEAARERAGR